MPGITAYFALIGWDNSSCSSGFLDDTRLLDQISQSLDLTVDQLFFDGGGRHFQRQVFDLFLQNPGAH